MPAPAISTSSTGAAGVGSGVRQHPGGRRHVDALQVRTGLRGASRASAAASRGLAMNCKGTGGRVEERSCGGHRQKIIENMIALDCYYSLSSPWAYFGGPQLQDIVRRHRVHLTLKPYDFQAVGAADRRRPAQDPARAAPQLPRAGAGALARLPRHAAAPGTRALPKGAPADPSWNKYPGWMVIAAQLQGLDAQPLSHALLRALWAEERDTSDPDVRIAVANENGYDGSALQALEAARDTQARYLANSAEAVELGVFGAPHLRARGRALLGPGPIGLPRSRA
jgi:2-hydroxychromene-2-carboxylate isomerase